MLFRNIDNAFKRVIEFFIADKITEPVISNLIIRSLRCLPPVINQDEFGHKSRGPKAFKPLQHLFFTYIKIKCVPCTPAKIFHKPWHSLFFSEPHYFYFICHRYCSISNHIIQIGANSYVNSTRLIKMCFC